MAYFYIMYNTEIRSLFQDSNLTSATDQAISNWEQ